MRFAWILLVLPRLAFADDPPTSPSPSPSSSSSAPWAAPSPDPEFSTPTSSEPWWFRPGAFIQPQLRFNEYSPNSGYQNGFRFARARVTGTASGRAGNIELYAYVEAELQPQFSLFDAYMTALRRLPRDGYIALDVGQTRVPISRQNMMSDTRLSFVDKPVIGQGGNGIAPDRDLGARLWIKPTRKDWLRVVAGVFNGEGRNQVQNINADYLWAARVEVTPFGNNHEMPFAESAFYGNWLTVAGSYGHNRLSPGSYHQIVDYYGVDVSGSYRGFGASFEYLYVGNAFRDLGPGVSAPSPDYHGLGYNAQLTYMLPMALPPFRESRLEFGARVEEYGRNNAIPITMPGDPNQSEREFTFVVSYYLRQHLLKAQLAASHFQQIENVTLTGASATYNHDQLLLQLTYRIE